MRGIVAASNVDVGDRQPWSKIGREIGKPTDMFSFGLIMLEIAANVKLPENGTTWAGLREGDFSEVPVLTQDAGAIIEWTIAFLFTFYLLTFFYDLLNSNRYPNATSEGLVEGGAPHGQGSRLYRPSYEPTGPAMCERPGM